MLCALYDELIISCEGYCWDGEFLFSTEEIRAKMDLHHKFTAARELLAPQVLVQMEGASAPE